MELAEYPTEKGLNLKSREGDLDVLEVALYLPNSCVVQGKDNDLHYLREGKIPNKADSILDLAESILDGVHEEGVEEEDKERCKGLKEEGDALQS